MLNFGFMSTLLDEKNNKYERIFKTARNINIESKRIIYLLQRLSDTESLKEIVTDAKRRLLNLELNEWKIIAMELQTESPLKFLRAYTFGLQEYIEAKSFCHYLECNQFLSWETVQEILTFNINNSVAINIPVTVYLLGICDLTGELMRKCINLISAGNFENCYSICTFLRSVYSGYQMIQYICPKEIRKKIWTLKQNLKKVENTCYTIRLRGSEIPKHILIDVYTSQNNDIQVYE